ncbi:MAG: FYDLN acid domain-containing protein [Kiloniellaceae bacterium]
MTTTIDRGLKHLCPECECKYYDMKKAVVLCPKCGAKPAPAKLPRSNRPVRTSKAPVPRNYP